MTLHAAQVERRFNGDYLTSGRAQRDEDYERALDYRRIARMELRDGRPNSHGYWMRKAIRFWRYYAEAVRKERA